VKPSLQIAQEAVLRPIAEIATELGLREDEFELYGRYKAKVDPGIRQRLADRPDGREIIVTAITPTPLGEGKSVTTIGLAQGLNRIGVRTAAVLREPSLGPVFGIKGGGAGGGYSQLQPMEDINLHFTGDLHAIAAAHNLAAAFLDNHLFRDNQLGIDRPSIRWPRVVDVNDRPLRRVTIGLGDERAEREAEWHITAASEVMAILALADDLPDLRRRLGRVVVAESSSGTPITLEDLRVAGAMAVLLRNASRPNLVQTLEGGPAFVHAGPFANIAHGNSSVVADRVALKLVDAVVTEAGFGSDMGFQKFVDIKCRLSGLRPAAAVIVATIRALKMHGGVGQVISGKPLDPALLEENPDAVARGCANLIRHIGIVHQHGVPAVVAINRFPTDAVSEIQVVQRLAREAGARAAVTSEAFARGGAGAEELARATWQAATTPDESDADGFRLLYSDDVPLATKIETIARRVYGADGVELAPLAIAQLARYEEQGYGALPICMAKTQLSLSHDASLKGAPTGFRLPVREARLFAGAGFITAYCGDMMMMPGLPARPSGEQVDLGPGGETVGLF